MTSKEIRELSPAEISTKLRETREQLLQLKLRKQTGQVETAVVRTTPCVARRSSSGVRALVSPA